MPSAEHASTTKPGTPRLSLLLPCRDAAATLPVAIDSLRAQEHTDFEVVAVDDGSSDETRRILAGWATEDVRVRVLRTARSRPGIVPALNLAAAAASAPLLGRMDADDVAAPTRLAAQVAFMSDNPDLAACGTHVEMFAHPGSDGPGPGYLRYQRWINDIETPEDVERSAFIECPVAHPTLLVKRSVFEALGGYRDTGWPEDYDLVLRLLAAGTRLANVAGPPLLRWRVRPDRLSLTDARYGAEAFRRCRAHFLVHRFLPAGRPVVVWGAGKVGKPLARELIAQGQEIAAFVDLDPRKIGQQIHGAPVWSPAVFAETIRKARESAAETRPYVLAAVGSPGVRGEIRAALEAAFLEEIDDFRFCA